MKDFVIPVEEEKVIYFPLNTRPRYSNGIISLGVLSNGTREQSHIIPVGVTLYMIYLKLFKFPIYSFNKYLSSTHYVSSMILGTENTEKKKDKILFSWSLQSRY